MGMSGAVTTKAKATSNGPVRASTLVDCDVHPLLGDVLDLRPHMSARAARRVFGQQMQVYARDPNRIPHPSSGLRLDARTPSGGAPGSDPAFALEQWIDRYEIAAAVLIPVQAGVVIPWGDEDAGVEFLGAMNRYFLENWTGLDSRYRLLISISPYNIPAAVAEIERYADTPGVAGVFVPAGGVGLGRSHYYPVYEAAEHYGMPIVLHPTGAEVNLTEAPRVAGGLPDTYPERHSMLLQPGQAVLASMIFGGVFERFPSLMLVLSEYGTTWAAPMAWRMDNAWEQGDRSLAALPKPPSAYVSSNVRFTTQPLDEPPEASMLNEFLDLLDAGRTLMFSSDYPHWDTDEPRFILNSRIPSELRERIASETALECFGDRLGLAAVT
jgi:predicted TIM-barrel fold metal-dependent hydrolase